MDSVGPTPGSSQKHGRGQLRYPVALGPLLIFLGLPMTVFGFMYGLGGMTGWPWPVLLTGLTVIPLGGVLILWRAFVSLDGRGWFAAVVRSVVLVTLACLLAWAAWAFWWLIITFPWDSRG
jgi:hypothetical protein